MRERAGSALLVVQVAGERAWSHRRTVGEGIAVGIGMALIFAAAIVVIVVYGALR